MKVDLKLFGPLRDIVQHDEMTLDVPAPHTGEVVFEHLASSFPELRKWKGSVRVAVNLEYASFDTKLSEGDELSFIPPVSGG